MSSMGKLIAVLALCVLVLALYAGSDADSTVQSAIARTGMAGAPTPAPGGGIPDNAEFIGTTNEVESVPQYLVETAFGDEERVASDPDLGRAGSGWSLSALVSRETSAWLLEWMLVLLVIATIADAVVRALTCQQRDPA